MELVSRVAKATIIALVMFGAVWMITGSVKISFLVALLPFIFGSLAIMSEYFYGLTAIVLVFAVVLAITPPELRQGIHRAYDFLSAELATSK